jgi:anaerobic selenocysteine-containing dehydrogenase
VGEKGSGEFAPASWEEALSEITSQLCAVRDRWGGEAILPLSYGGSNGWLSDGTADACLFLGLGAANLLRTVCAAPSGRAQEGLFGGKFPGVALEDFLEAKAIVLWGVNPAATGVHLIPILEEARRRGAWIAVVDPRRTGTAVRADLHLQPLPGTDLPLALSLIRECFVRGVADRLFLTTWTRNWQELQRRAMPWTLERAARVADVPVHALEELFLRYTASSPAVIRCGWGVERHRHGGSAVAAILGLPCVAGKFGVRGGGFTLSNSGAFQRPNLFGNASSPPKRSINMNRLGRALLELQDPPIAFLFVYNCNPWATLPEQKLVEAGLRRPDLFTVVLDSVLTDTARFADWVLPATHFLEHHEIHRGYGAYGLQRAGPVVPPPGEARSNYSVFRELAARCRVEGWDSLPTEEREAGRRLLERCADGERLLAELDSRGWVTPSFGSRPIQFRDVFPLHPDRKVDLVPETLERECPGGLYAFQEMSDEVYPLRMVTPASPKRISSTFGGVDRQMAKLALHPQDAEPRGIQTGSCVRVWNQLGEVLCQAEVSDRLRPGVVELPKGLWSHHTFNRWTGNVLISAELTDLGGGAVFNAIPVEVTLCQTGASKLSHS